MGGQYHKSREVLMPLTGSLSLADSEMVGQGPRRRQRSALATNRFLESGR